MPCRRPILNSHARRVHGNGDRIYVEVGWCSSGNSVMRARNRRFDRLPRNVRVLGMVSFFTDLSTEMIYPLLPLFLSSVLHASVAFIGLVEGIAESTASLLRLLSGWLADRSGRRKSLIFVGYGISTVVKPLFAVAAVPWHVLALRFGERLGKGIRTAPRDALIADSTDPLNRGAAYGFHRAADTLGAVGGPLTASVCLWALAGDLRKVFLLSFIPAAAAVLVIVLRVRDVARPTPATDPPVHAHSPALSRRVMWLIAAISIFSLGNSSDAFLALRAHDIGIPLIQVPLLFLTMNVVYSLGAYPVGKLSDRIGRKRIVLTGMLVYALAYLGFAVVSIPGSAWPLFAFYGAYHALTDGSLRAIVADLVPAERAGTAFGLYHGTVGLMALPASVIMGAIWNTYGAPAAFGLGAVLALVAACLLVCVIVDQRAPPVSPADSGDVNCGPHN